MQPFGFGCSQKVYGVSGLVFERRFVPGRGVVTASGTLLGGINGDINANLAQEKTEAKIEFTPVACSNGCR